MLSDEIEVIAAQIKKSQEAAEGALLRDVNAAMKKFNADTGLHISDVDVHIVCHEALGRTTGSVLCEVRVKTSLPAAFG